MNLRLKHILTYIYQLPQHLLALILIPILRAQKGDTFTTDAFLQEATLYFIPAKLYFSLGNYIFLHKAFVSKLDIIIEHEFGHTIQSRMYGPLYLLIVGIPSFIFAALTKLGILDPISYYDRFPENEADTLAGIRRYHK